ncbi:Maltose-binding periplasmic protein precursor [compost metagenome]
MASDKDKELIIWHEFDGPGDTSIQVLEELCEQYSRENGIKVTPEVMNISLLVPRLRDVAKGGQAPHMAFVPADMAVFVETALYSTVPEQLSSIVEGYGTGDLASMQVESVQYGLPVIKGNHMVLYYNREIFDQPPVSWEEIEGLREKLKQKGIVPIGADLQDPYWFIPFFTGFGGWPLHEGKPAILNQEMEKALHFVSDQMETGNLISLNGSHELLEQFIAGQVGAIYCGEWIFNYLDQQMGARLGVSGLPSIYGKPSISMSSSIGLVFPNRSLDLDSEVREEILSFAAFMLSEESQLKWGSKVQRCPVHPAVQAQLLSTYSQNRVQLLGLLKESRPMPIERIMNTVWNTIASGLDQLQEQGAVAAYQAMEQASRDKIDRIQTN